MNTEVITSRYIMERGESIDEDSDDDCSYEKSYGAVNKRARVTEEREARAWAREMKRWATYRALVKEARDAHAASKHRAWVASIPSSSPMGIILPDENESEEKQKGCAQANQEAGD